jgi:hypothetical protein
MAKEGGGVGRVRLLPSDKNLASNIARLENESTQSTSGPFGTIKSGARTYEYRSSNPMKDAADMAEVLADGGVRRNLRDTGWIADFRDGSAVTFRKSTKSLPGMPGVTLTIRNGKSKEVYEIHFLRSVG